MKSPVGSSKKMLHQFRRPMMYLFLLVDPLVSLSKMGIYKNKGTVSRKDPARVEGIIIPLSRRYRSSASSDVSSSTTGPRERVRRQEVYREDTIRHQFGYLSKHYLTVCSQ